jgi:hypothetical protein
LRKFRTWQPTAKHDGKFIKGADPMNMVPVKWANSQKRFDATQSNSPARSDSGPSRPVQRPPLRVLQEQRAREAAQAVRDYEASKRAVDAKTERLRALRLAREAISNAPMRQTGKSAA